MHAVYAGMCIMHVLLDPKIIKNKNAFKTIVEIFSYTEAFSKSSSLSQKCPHKFKGPKLSCDDKMSQLDK